MPTNRTFNPGEVALPSIYSHAVASPPNARLIHTAGQIGTDLKGNTPSSYPEQISIALANLEAALRAAGAGVADIVKLTYYIVKYDPSDRPHAKLVSEWLKGHKPSTTLVPVPALAAPQYLFEIEAVAAVTDPSTLPPYIRPPAGGLSTVDVVVVGAGLSGLQAAHDVQKAGYSCVILEARDRVGGKTYSVPVNNGTGVQDVGAAWINSVSQSRMWALAQRFGLETVEQNVNGHAMSQEVGPFQYGSLPNFSKEDQDNIASVRDKFEELCQKIDIQKPWTHGSEFKGLTVADLVRKLGGNDLTLSTVTIWTRAMLGKEPHQASALFFLDYCKAGGGLLAMRSDTYGGGQHLRIRTGTQSFSIGLAATLQPGTVLLSSPVKAITQTPLVNSPLACTVTTVDGTRFLAHKVIVSVPTPLLMGIEFTPPLPPSKQALASKTSLGFLTKVIVLYSSPWWRSRGFCGLMQSFSGPIAVSRDSSVDLDGVFALTCFLVGDAGIAWSQIPTLEGRKSAIISHLTEIYGADTPAPTNVIIQNWNDEQWSKGGPSPVMMPGLMEEYGEALRASVAHIHFVGTETSYEWKGYMEGAVRSGERGAREVVEELREADKKSIRLRL